MQLIRLLTATAVSLAGVTAQQFTSQELPTGHGKPVRALPGDFDGDGTLDLFVVQLNNFVQGGFQVWSRLANGTWGMRVKHAFGKVSGAAVAELDGDGRPEVILAAANSPVFPLNSVIVIRFSPRMEPTFTTVASGGGELALLRGDQDALPDVFLFSQSNVSFLRNLGGGNFAAAVDTTIVPPTSWEDTLRMNDFDGDGFADLLFVARMPAELVLYRGNGAGGFLPAIVTPIPFYTWNGALTIDADIDGNGIRDVIVRGRVMLGTNSGTFVDTTVVIPGNPFDCGDVDGDGRTDVFSEVPGGLTPYLQQAPLVFTAGNALPLGSGAARSVLDVDQDGFLDVLRLHVDTVGPIQANLYTRDRPHQPPHVWPYGIGTPGCKGHIALSANRDPVAGDPGFAITATNAPTSAIGVLAVSWQLLRPEPSQPGGLGFDFVLPLSPSYVAAVVPFFGNTYGQAHFPVPLPAAGSFLMQCQAIWLAPDGDGACSASPLGFVSSNALQVLSH
ncbi:MAG: VCBS repeat-containing protein [Planctomycetes bacterium]|nr:VCBS repeat-containing protein [Planctomycetota bacterium]